MPTPFPGMNPYLEHPHLWPDVHLGLISAIRDDLASRVSPRYVVAVEERTNVVAVAERTYISSAVPDTFLGRADVAITGSHDAAPIAHVVADSALTYSPVAVQVPALDRIIERYLEVRDAERGYAVTVIEILSPGNKRSGSRGYVEYLAKRERSLVSITSLVEIDLLRSGDPPPLRGDIPESDYRILVSRGWQRPHADLYPFDVQHPIPEIPIPLQKMDEEPKLDLTRLLHDLYDRAVYNLRIDYTKPPTPPLADEAVLWTDRLLTSAALR
ncbi:MAG: DUF4058 family protein [Chloroflexi bacterium]|nr:DUF4058 family protein [Chloroflexota bacterium]